jgi:hypothetical protein
MKMAGAVPILASTSIGVGASFALSAVFRLFHSKDLTTAGVIHASFWLLSSTST